MEFLKEQKAQQKVSQFISTLKNSTKDEIDQIVENEKFKKIFTNKYEKYITNLIDGIGTPNFSELYKNSPFQEKNIQTKSANVIDRFYEKYQQADLITIPTEHNSPIPESYKLYAYDVHRAISEIFRKDKLQKKYETTLNISQATVDLAKLSVWDSIKYFFLTDFGFTSKQLAQGLLLLVNPKARAKAEQFLPEIEYLFNSSYAKSLKAGNINILKGMIFALQVVVYATNAFRYLFVISTKKLDGIAFETSSFMHLFEKFYENQNRLTLNVDMDPIRGGSAITIK